jgi:hypothetical protein
VAAWKLIAAALKARKTLARIPPEQRRKIVESAGAQARTYGPVIARRIRKALDDFNKPIR